MISDSRIVTELVPQEKRALSMPFCFLFYESEDPLCERTAISLRSSFRQVAEPLYEAMHPIPMSVNELRTVLEAESSPERRAVAWESLERCGLELFNPVDFQGKAAPHCILLVSARYLLEGSNRQLLIRELQEATPYFSQFMIVFFAKSGEVPFSAEENEFREWLKVYARFDYKPVSIHVVSPTFDGGEPISAGDLADAVAKALTADMVLPHARSARILSDIEEGHSIELATFGVKSIQFDPWQNAENFRRRVAAELLRRTVFKEGDGPQCRTLQISSPIDVLNNRKASGTGTRSASGDVGFAFSQPSVIWGKDYSVQIQGGWIPDEDQLDAMPESEWISVLHDSAKVLALKLHSTFADDAEDAIKRHVQSETAFLKSRLAQEFSSIGGFRAGSTIWEGIDRQLHEVYPKSDSTGEDDSAATPLDQMLSELREAIRQIPTTDQLLGKMALRFVPWLGPGLLAWYCEVPFSGVILLAGGLFGVWGALPVFGRWRRAKSRARTLRNKVLKRMRDGAFSTLSGTIRNLVDRAGQELVEASAVFRKKIEATQGELFKLAANKEPMLGPTRSSAIQRLPSDAEQTERIFSSWWSSESLVNGVEHEFRRMIHDYLLEILAATKSPGELCQAVERFALKYSFRRLQTLKLWNFFQEDVLSAVSPLVAEKVGLAHCKFQSRPLVFLQNIVVRDASLRSERIRHLIVGPRVLQPSKLTAREAASCVMDNTLAGVFCVRLAELSPAGSRELAESDEQPGADICPFADGLNK